MQDTEDQEGQDHNDPKHQVDQEHIEVEVVLDRLPARPLGYGDPHEVGAIDEEQGEESQHHVEQLFQPGSYRRNVFLYPDTLPSG